MEISAWMDGFLRALDDTFTNRVWFVGLQGSYGRGEATESSDIDVVVILDELTSLDIQIYREMLDRLPHRELICGFLSGKDELLCWEPSDLFQFYYDTNPIRGRLDELLPMLDAAAVDRAIKMGVCNIYHGCLHNMLHARSEEMLVGLYKTATFVVQAVVFRQTGNYVRHKAELLEAAAPREQGILNTFLYLKNGGVMAFDKMAEELLSWASDWIKETK